MLGADNKLIFKCIEMLSLSFCIWYDFIHTVVFMFVPILWIVCIDRKKKFSKQFDNSTEMNAIFCCCCRCRCRYCLMLMLMSLLLNAKAQPRTYIYIATKTYNNNRQNGEEEEKNAKQINAQIQWIVIPVVDQTINYTIGFKFEWFLARMRFDNNKRKS